MAKERCPECGHKNMLLIVYRGKPMTCTRCGYQWELFDEKYSTEDEVE